MHCVSDSVLSSETAMKIELIDVLRDEAELTKSEAAAVVNLCFIEMANALAKGDRIEIR
jgi:integration host factor subunit beta